MKTAAFEVTYLTVQQQAEAMPIWAPNERLLGWSGFVFHVSEILDQYTVPSYLDLPADVQDGLERDLGAMMRRFGLPPL